MEFTNGINVFLLLAFASLFCSANAICVPRNSSRTLTSIEVPAQQPQASPQQTPEQAPPQQTPQESPEQAPQQTPKQAPAQAPPAESPVTDSPAPTATDEAASNEASSNEATSNEASSNEASSNEAASNEASSNEESSNEAASNEESSNEASSGESSNESSDESSNESSDLLGLGKLNSDLISSVASAAKTELVEICDVTSNPQLCKSSISSHIEGSVVDPVTALKTEIQESIKEVEKAIAKLNALSKDSAASHAEVECYDTCLENFDMAVEDLKAGLESIDARDTGKMESVLTAVSTDLMTCDDTFIEMGVDSPLDNLSAKMEKFASNCLAISKLLL